MIKSNSLKVGYGNNTILDELDFQIGKGEIICLMGPNGSGKSTIIKTISRHIRKLGGNVYISEKNLDAFTHKEIAKLVSVVLTDKINPELMTVAELVATGRYPHTNYMGKLGEKDLEVIEHSLNIVNANNLKDKYITELSDGQRQRIMLARAICQEADVMILDEPTSFLDVRYKIELLDILRKLAYEYNTTIILSLHEIDLIPKIADRVVLISEDSKYKFGYPEEIINDNYIKDAFNINYGSFSTLIGNIELTKAESSPQIFVVGGEGKATEIYRMLNKNWLAFYAGVLFENDIDIIVANSLAENIVVEKAFSEIEDTKIEQAKELIKKCNLVIDVGSHLDGINNKNRELIQFAKENDIRTLTLVKRNEYPWQEKVDCKQLNSLIRATNQ